MTGQWVDTSTESVEFYCKELTDRSALVFRMCRAGVDYNACVSGARVRCAQTTFSSLAEAQAWADRELGVVLQEDAVGA
jgi:hypothetical protein